MRNRGIVFLLGVCLAGCTGAQLREQDEDEKKQSAAEAGNQHMALAVLASMYYCEKGEWPVAVANAQAYATQGEIKLPVTPDWDLWMDSATKYEATQDLVLRTPAMNRDGYDFPVSTTVNSPGCDQGNIDIRPHITIGK